MDRADLAVACYEVALASRFPAAQGDRYGIYGAEYARLLRRIVDGRVASAMPALARARLKALACDLDDADLVVVLEWSTDVTDVDLHVVEPSGEDCCYRRTRTRAGGRITADVTTGFGPEMYVLRRAPRGTYRVRCDCYADDPTRTGRRTQVHALVYRGFGRADETVETIVVEVAPGARVQEIATLVFE